MQIFFGIMIPFIGTTIGSLAVFLMKKEFNIKIEKFLYGFASGIMVAASIWSLIMPSIEMAEKQNVIAWIPASIGFVLGILFLLLINYFVSKLNNNRKEKKKIEKTFIMALAVTLHNIPEGMAVGVCFAGALTQNVGITISGAMALAIGIAIQNIPEGAIISMPLKNEGISKIKSLFYGVVSGIVEPIGAFITILLINIVISLLPYLLSFAAGAMIYVVVEELVPEMHIGGKSSLGVIGVTLGFIVMMVLDIALG